MKVHLYPLFLFILFQTNGLLAQSISEQHLELETRSYSSTEDYLPFWLWANQKGRIAESGKFHTMTDMKFDGSYSDSAKRLKLNYGVSLVASIASAGSSIAAGSGPGSGLNPLQLNQAFVTIAYKIAFLKIGEQAAETKLEGLSATNGDFDYSNNSRPYPSLLIGTNGFLKIYRNFSLSALYEEALIRDKYEYVKNPNLQHKNFFVRWSKTEKFTITAGIEDYAWWGGTSPDPAYGKMASGLSDYARVITVWGAGPNASYTERDNALGNHLGQYKLTVEKEVNNQTFIFYLCHPIDDHSGVKWQNYPDNLAGVFWKHTQQRTLISSALFEFCSTLTQNIRPANSIVVPKGQTPVNYFNNGVYLSGHTYKGNVIGSPLFYPVVYDSAGRIIEIASTRLFAFHGGLGGSIGSHDHYKALLTYSVNSGIWKSYPSKFRRISTLFEYDYFCTNNLTVNCALAYDFMHQSAENKQVLGGYLGIKWTILP